MAAPPLLALREIRYSLADQTVLDGAAFGVGRGERLCLVGRNGAGKSTLLKIAAGLLASDGGERFVQPGTTIAYLPQEPDLGIAPTVASYLAGGLQDEHGIADDDYRVAQWLETIKLDGARDTASLSGGESRRAAIARALIGNPDILLLDEPTNHLDLPTIEWLEALLEAWRGGFVLISHDRRFLTNLAQAVLWLDRGMVRRLDDGYARFEAWSEDILAREDVERQKLDRLIETETAWSVTSIRARRTRNEGRMRRLRELRETRRNLIAQTGRAVLEAGAASQSGTLAIEAKGITKRFGERVILKPFSTRILRGDRVGIIGPNGAGKTTLLRMLIGELEPDAGTTRRSPTLQPVVIDQRRAQLDPAQTVWEALAERNDHILVQGKPKHVVGYMRQFLFRDEQARQPVGALSGGERNRLLLAKALAAPSNLLVLDEPTNDLDADTLDLLQETLADYDGTVLLISHDRDFLDRVVTSTIALEGDGTATEYAGGYSDYLLQRGPRAAPPAPPPAASAAKPAPTPRNTDERKPRKLNSKQQRALDALPKKIEALHAEIATLSAALADPGLYRRDAAAFSAKTTRLTAAQAELDAAEHEWLELEMLREELAG
ncbi:MAG TPA: ATP-binding cassette domain-containing protein [Vineibacter sp.]|nr:ATP-binding cassette domain-containing protein [Vineibacter sp.]